MAGAVLAAALLLAGCSKEPADPTSGPVKIEVAASVPGGVRAPRPGGNASTKATVSGEEQMHLYFAVRTADESGTFVQRGGPFLGLRAAGDGARMLSFTPEQYYPEDGGSLEMYGWYPLADVITENEVTWNLDGTKDVMLTYRQTGSAASPLTNINFEHRLTQLQIYAFGEKGAAARWGKITDVQVHINHSRFRYSFLENKGVYLSPSGRVSPLGFTPTAIPEGDASVAVRLGEPVMVPPVTAKQYVISFYTEKGGEVMVTLPERDYKVGAVSKVMVWFTAATVAVKPGIIEIEDWDDLDNMLTYDYPRLTDDNIVITAGLTGFMENVEFHEPWTKTPIHVEPNGYDRNESGLNTVSRKFRVAKSRAYINGYSDIMFPHACGLVHATVNPDGYDICANYTEEGVEGPWRLPTAMEFKAIQYVRLFNIKKDEYDGLYWFTATARATIDMNTLPWRLWLMKKDDSYTGIAEFSATISAPEQASNVLCIKDIE